MTESTPRVPFWESRLVLGPIVALCALLTLILCLRAPRFFHQDGVHYLSIAEHLARGQGYKSAMYLFPDLMQPPLYPMLAAGLMVILGTPFAAGVALCMLAMSMSVLAVYFLHSAIFGPRGRLFSVVAAALCPNIAVGTALTLEPLFVCLLGFAVYLGVTAATKNQAKQRWRAVGCGVLLGLALLTRPEVVLTGAGLLCFYILWPARWRFCAAAVMLIGVGFLAIAVPYGLWMRSKLGYFEVLPKVRYNVPVADITENMHWEAHELRTSARDQRTGYSLMPDHRTFILHHAFATPGFDPRPLYPRTPDPGPLGLDGHLQRHGKMLTVHAPAVIGEGVRLMGVFQPLAAAAMAALLFFLLRRRPLPEAPVTGLHAWLTTGLLFGLVGLHLLPAVISGEDFESRYLAPSLFFSLPLVGAGAAHVHEALGRRWRPGAAIALCLAASYCFFTLRTARSVTGGPRPEARFRAVGAACQQHLPQGARILAEHNRCAFLINGASFQLPYVRMQGELLDYIKGHDIQYAVLDGRTLRKNPSLADQELADPHKWPRGWVPVAGLFEGDDPVWLVKVQ